MAEQKEYTLDNLPEDFGVNTEQSAGKNYDPLPQDVYQVEVLGIKLRDNFFYDPKEEYSNKYVLEFTFAVIEEGPHYGRRLWRSVAPALKPQGKRGPTILYKIVTTALGSEMDWDACAGFAEELKENLKVVIGKQMRVSVEQRTSESGKVSSKIASFMPIKKELPKYDENIHPENDLTIDEFLKDLDN